MSDDHRRKIGEANRRTKQNATPEQKEAWSAARRGRKVSDETRAKIARSLTGRPGKQWTDEMKAEHAKKFLGHEVSEEAREKIRRKNTGRKLSPEQRAKISRAQIGKKTSEAAKEKQRARWKEREAKWNANGGHPLKGRPLTPEHRAAIKRVREKLRADPERVEMVSAKLRASWDDERRQAIAERQKRNLHVRWHVNRGVVNPDCSLCAAE